MATINKKGYGTRATSQYDRSGNNPTHVVSAAHNPYLRDVVAPVDTDSPQYRDFRDIVMGDMVDTGLVRSKESGQAAGATYGELGSDSRAGTFTELDMLNPRKFLLNQRAMQGRAMGRELGLRDQANRMADALAPYGVVSDVAQSGLGVWGAMQDADEAQQDMMERKSQADFQRGQQNAEARSIGSASREATANAMPGAMARRSGRGQAMNRERIFWNGGY